MTLNIITKYSDSFEHFHCEPWSPASTLQLEFIIKFHLAEKISVPSGFLVPNLSWNHHYLTFSSKSERNRVADWLKKYLQDDPRRVEKDWYVVWKYIWEFKKDDSYYIIVANLSDGWETDLQKWLYDWLIFDPEKWDDAWTQKIVEETASHVEETIK